MHTPDNERRSGTIESRCTSRPATSRPQLLRRLGDRSIVFVGLMGAGKTAIGRKVAAALGLPFVDSDHEIETVSRMTIPELFERYGEAGVPGAGAARHRRASWRAARRCCRPAAAPS